MSVRSQGTIRLRRPSARRLAHRSLRRHRGRRAVSRWRPARHMGPTLAWTPTKRLNDLLRCSAEESVLHDGSIWAGNPRGEIPGAYPIIATIRAIARFRGWLTDYGGWVCLHIVAPYVFVLAPPWREVVPLSRRGCVRALRGSRSRRTGSMTAAAALRRTLR